MSEKIKCVNVLTHYVTDNLLNFYVRSICDKRKKEVYVIFKSGPILYKA